MTKFQASVQYNDLKGTIAADNADDGGLRRYAKEKGLLGDNDLIAGIRVWVGENHGGPVQPANIELLVVPSAEYKQRMDANPLKARSVEFEMPIEQFVGLFKRFELAFSTHPISDYEVEK